MEPIRFDNLTRFLAPARSRRQMLVALVLGGVVAGDVAIDVQAGPGCKNVGKKCKKAAQCCSGICKGKKGKKKCKAHDTGGCPSGLTETFCGSPSEEACTTSGGLAGVCDTTTGNAGYCLVGGGCTPCTKDADCRAICGSTAACIQCAACEETGGTLCATAEPGNCGFPL